jgi:5-methylcytosine-specific restriction endonuclease McrA
MNKCLCGCGQLCKNKFVKGHSLKIVRISTGHKGHKHSEQTRLKWSKLRKNNPNKGFPKGSNHPNYKHGLSELKKKLTKTVQYSLWREKVYKRDKWTCRICNKHCEEKEIVAHHVKSFIKLINEAISKMPLFDKIYVCLLYEPLWNIKNGITLCRKCHLELHKKLLKKGNNDDFR